MLARADRVIKWTYLSQPIEMLRQSLEAMLRIEGPATAKLQIDEASPSARELAQVLDAKVEGGIYDALSMCVYQAKEDDDFRSGDIKVITNWSEEEERKYR